MRNYARRRSGLSLIEALLALAITSGILVSLNAAFYASASAVESGDASFHCMQTARLALNQIVTEVRRADAVQVDAAGANLQVIRPEDQRAPHEIYRQYSYDAPRKRLTLQIFYAGDMAGSMYEIATDITACSFGPAEQRADSGAAPVVIRVPVSITCSRGQGSATLCATAAPRRAQR